MFKSNKKWVGNTTVCKLSKVVRKVDSIGIKDTWVSSCILCFFLFSGFSLIFGLTLTLLVIFIIVLFFLVLSNAKCFRVSSSCQQVLHISISTLRYLFQVFSNFF